MLDRPTTREGWLARAAALKIERRAFIDGAYVQLPTGRLSTKSRRSTARSLPMSPIAARPTSTRRSIRRVRRSRAASGVTPTR